jgi:hypothetical protein
MNTSMSESVTADDRRSKSREAMLLMRCGHHNREGLIMQAADAFRDCRILTSRLRLLCAFKANFFRNSNYRFLTPPKKKTEFRKQKTEWIQNRGVENG